MSSCLILEKFRNSLTQVNEFLKSTVLLYLQNITDIRMNFRQINKPGR